MTRTTATTLERAAPQLRRERLASKAPARVPPRPLLITTTTSVLGLVLLVALGSWMHETVLIPSLAASMALISGASATPLGQPRNVIGGQLVAAATGFLVLHLGGQGPWTAAVAGGLALGVMLLLRVSHSPAAATAVIVVLTNPPTGKFLALLALATVILVLVGIAGNRLAKQAYPLYWW